MNLISRIFRQKIYAKHDCPICFEYVADDKNNILSCGHWCHYDCIVNYYKYQIYTNYFDDCFDKYNNKVRCPVCRTPLKIISKEKYITVLKNYFYLLIQMLVYSSIKLPEVIESLYILYRIFNR